MAVEVEINGRFRIPTPITLILILFLVNFNQFNPVNCREYIINLENIRENYQKMDYTMHGPIYKRSNEIAAELKRGEIKPFKQVTPLNVVDARAEGLKPMAFVRQVLAVATYPLLSASSYKFPTDVIERAQMINNDTAGGLGSYSDPEGQSLIRKNVAKFIQRRDDGIESNFEDVYLTDGVGDGMTTIMKLLQLECDETRAGVMIPLPEYPYYSSLLEKHDLHRINYYLDEEKDWELKSKELKRAYDDALRNCNCKPRAIVIINPGNPSAKLHSRKTIECIIRFARSRNLLILADEIYQENIYRTDLKFESFKKISNEMGTPYSKMELITFNSISKGYINEAGFRGGYFEFVNMDPAIKNVLFQLLSQKQCANRLGQVGLNCLVDPPRPGEPSYDLFTKQKTGIIEGYKKIALKMAMKLNKLEGYSCPSIDVGFSAFPKIYLPPKALKAAEINGTSADLFYGMELLESTGIAVAVGTAFGLSPNLTYLRITLPSSMVKLNKFLKQLETFHMRFLKKYS